MRKWFIKLAEKIFRKMLQRKGVLTPKGYYFREYCGAIVNDSYERMEEYEKMLDEIRECLILIDGAEVSRVDAARYFYELTAGMDMNDGSRS